jgi:hypothetical protein
MNTRSSKEYRYIFTTTWKQASTSHLSSRLTDNASGKLLIIFILSYLFVLSTSFLRIHKTHNRTSLQVWMQMYCTFVLFVNHHFPGLPASGTHCTSFKTDQVTCPSCSHDCDMTAVTVHVPELVQFRVSAHMNLYAVAELELIHFDILLMTSHPSDLFA